MFVRTVRHVRWALHAAGEKPVLDCLVEAERQRVEALLAGAPTTDWRTGLAHLAGDAASAMTARGSGG